MSGSWTVLEGDARERLAEMEPESVQCVVTSPPYWGLRDYSVEGQIGLESTPEEYVATLVEVFHEVRRVLAKDGTVWLNLGDSYSGGGGYSPDAPSNLAGAKQTTMRDTKQYGGRQPALGLKPKDLVGIPWKVAFALQADGWWLRSDIVWSKPNPMPESVTDRPTKAHEYIFLLTKSARYFYDADAVREPHAPKTLTHRGGGGNGFAGHQDATGKVASGNWGDWGKPRIVDPAGRQLRSVWTIATEPFSGRELVGDTFYTRSVDCPEHGLRADPQSWQRAARGEPQDWTRYRIDRTAARRALEQSAVSASSSSRSPLSPASDDGRTLRSMDESRTSGPLMSAGSPIVGESSESRTKHTESSHVPQGGSSDLPNPSRSSAASSRSSQNHRRDLAPGTSRPYTSSAGSLDHTGDTEASPALFVPGPDMSESRTLEGSDEGVTGNGRLARTSPRSGRKCTCVVDSVPDHFATFPKALVEPCIKAGTSEKGNCPECGKPWVRVVESSGGVLGSAWLDHATDSTVGNRPQRPGTKRAEWDTYRRESKGWRSTCPHDAEPVPAIVLDPFCGSGTTGVVALRLGRSFVGIELSPIYAQMARDRITDDAPLFNAPSESLPLVSLEEM